MNMSLLPAAPSRRAVGLARAVSVAAVGAVTLSLLPGTAAATPTPAATSTSLTKVAPNSTATLAGMSVSGFDPADRLQVTVSTDHGTVAVAPSPGLDLAFGNNWSGDSAVTFSGTPSEVNTGLASASLTVGDIAGQQAKVSVAALVEESGYVYSPANEHFYEYVEAPGISWTDASAAAQMRTFNDETGYLATIPNDEVNDLISTKLQGAENVWFGAIADQTPNDPIARTWKWSGGPLAGQPISKCTNYENVCDFVDNDGLYSHWAFGEPNNAGASRTYDPMCDEWWMYSEDPPSSCNEPAPWDMTTGEWVAVTNWGGDVGHWNDLPPVLDGGIAGYLVEYGGEPMGSTTFAGVVSDTSTVSIEGVPGAPTAVTADGENESATVSFAPAPENGSAVTGYTVTASPGGATCTTASTSCTVEGLTNGQTYSFTVVATNANGDGPASESAEATPAGVPAAPTNVNAEPGDRTALVFFNPPSDNGGAEITGYTVTAHPGGASSGCTASPCTVDELVNGEEYTFTVEATNAMGSSAPSEASSPVVPAGLPGAPGNVSATHGDETATVTFDESAPNGSAVTRYTVTSSPGGATESCPGSPCTVYGLSNGTPYTFTVVATNGVGDSEPSDSDPVTPRTVPNPPGPVTATRGDGSLALEFTPPTSDGGAAITGYEYTLDGGDSWHPLATSGTSPLSATVTGLDNGADYSVAVRAVNSEGASSGSEAGRGTPAGRPSAPTEVSATRGDGRATVSFSAPSDNGSAITGYTVTSDPGGVTAPCEESPCEIEGLTNGTSYTFTVVATNAVGDSDPSAASDPVVPATTPGAPTEVKPVSHDGAISLSFVAPSEDGGAEITGYEVSVDGGDSWQWLTVSQDEDVLTGVVGGLTNGELLAVAVRALNDLGPGAASSPDAAVTPAGKPGAPTEVAGVLQGLAAEVSWGAPSDDGGSPVTGYTVTAAPGGATCSTTGATSCTVDGLEAGETYVFTVVATNRADHLHGTGEGPGADSEPMTVSAEPGAPTALDAKGGDRILSLSWQAPESEGTSPVTSYEVSLDGGSTWDPTTSTGTSPVKAVIERVLNGQTYQVAVRARNATGPGSAGDVVAVTPRHWFADPLTKAQRAALVPVPRRPELYRGPVRRTRATARAHDGTPAMAADKLDGRRMQPGQAAHLGYGTLFEFDRAVLSSAGRARLRAMVPSLRWVDGVTCEGYADYGGPDRHARVLSEARARMVCRALRDYGAEVRTSIRGFGNDVPVVLSSDRRPDRAPNRRVVLLVTR